ncbi:MAG: ATP synthase F1 subunit delta [candidate division KSB1 bacterium]|nr:ATP synthase F1 subunit delta [candidate division KSB1 bacterium]
MRSRSGARGKALAASYAGAAHAHITQEWVAHLRSVWNRLSADRECMAELSDVGKAFEERRQRLDQLLPASISREARNMLYVMLREGHLPLLGEVVEQLAHSLAGAGRNDVAEVITAVPPTAAERQALQAEVAKRFGEDVAVHFHVDPDILGGVVIKVGDKVLNGSLAGRLAALHDKLRDSR